MPATAFSVVEDGEARRADVTRLPDQLQVVLVVDTSGSMAGRRWAARRRRSASSTGPGRRADRRRRLRREPAWPAPSPRTGALAACSPRRSETAGHDPVRRGRALAAGFRTRSRAAGSIVVLSDGGDTVSEHGVAEVTPLDAWNVQLDAVGLATGHADAEALRQLARRWRTVRDAADGAALTTGLRRRPARRWPTATGHVADGGRRPDAARHRRRIAGVVADRR